MALYRKYADDYQIPFFDYSNDSLCLNKELFYNTTHLNKKGADLFSKKLASDLRTGDILKVYK
jgi:lysophospholipase L1-like esterase